MCVYLCIYLCVYLYSEPSVCRSALGLSPFRHDRFDFPFFFPGVGLPSVDRLFWGKERLRRSPEVCFWVLIFVSDTRLPDFLSLTTGSSRRLGTDHEAPSPVIFSEKATHTSGIWFEFRFRFGLWISKLKFWLCFVTIPEVCQRLPREGLVRFYVPPCR